MSRLFEPVVDGLATGMMAFVLDRQSGNYKRESGLGGVGGRRPSRSNLVGAAKSVA
jgi:hypothetical protein